MPLSAKDLLEAFNEAGVDDRAKVVRLLRTISPVADAERERRLLRLRAREQALTDELATIQEEIGELEASG